MFSSLLGAFTCRMSCVEPSHGSFLGIGERMSGLHFGRCSACGCMKLVSPNKMAADMQHSFIFFSANSHVGPVNAT